MKRFVGWHPIETAPTDGTYVLGWSKRHGMSIGPVANYKRREMPAPKNSVCGWFQPTHWLPLPSPPDELT